jgi:hypothetical protein
LEYFTIGYNSLEGVISIVAGLIAGSVSLVGYGLDSLIEVTSGAALVWRLHHDLNVARREQVERTALRTVGACFIALAMYILLRIQFHVGPARSSGAKHCGHRDREHLDDRHPRLARAKRRELLPDWQPSNARRFKTGRLL